MNDSDRIQQALEQAALILAAAVGLPPDDFASTTGPRNRFPSSRVELVDRDRVPEPAYRGACCALDYLLLSLGIFEDGAPVSVEDGLAMITARRRLL